MDIETLRSIYQVELHSDEKLLWSGKPLPKPYLLNELTLQVRNLGFVAGLIVVTGFLPLFYGKPYAWGGLRVGSWFLGLVAIIQTLGVAVRTWRLVRTQYAISNRRVLILKKRGGNSAKSIYLKDIETKEIRKRWFEPRYGVASIAIYTGETENDEGTINKLYDHLYALADAQTAFLLLAAPNERPE